MPTEVACVVMKQENQHTAIAYHAPPQRIGIAAEIRPTVVCLSAFLGQVDEVRWKDEAQEPDIQCRYQFL